MNNNHLPNEHPLTDEVLQLVCGELDDARQAEVRKAVAGDATLAALVGRLGTAVAAVLAESDGKVSDEFNVRLRLRMLVPGTVENHEGKNGKAAGDVVSESGSQGSAERLFADRISIVVRPASSHATHLPTLVRYFSQLGPFSYFVSAVLMCIAVFAAWQFKMADPAELKYGHSFVAAPPKAEIAPVGQVTDMDACRWSEETAAKSGRGAAHRLGLLLESQVAVGRRINLDSGLLEITFHTGAKVILQGPAAFEVEANGGFLRIGKLTGRLEEKTGDWNPSSAVPNPDPFAIRTPTAIVTDLGTEFGVEVDQNGCTTSHVFRGSVQLRSLVSGENQEAFVLKENEGARVEVAENRVATISRVDVEPSRFVRRVSNQQWVPIKVFSTGIGLTVGQEDPHWQVVAIGGSPEFQSRRATVFRPESGWIGGSTGQPQWISTRPSRFEDVRNGTIYTFRTTFELKDVPLESVIVHGWFAVSKYVKAIRLNGESIPVPKQHNPAYDFFHEFTIDRGFVDGANVLEFDAVNSAPSDPEGWGGTAALRVDLEGTVREK